MSVDLLNFKQHSLKSDPIYISSHYQADHWPFEHIRSFGAPFFNQGELKEGIVIVHPEDLNFLARAPAEEISNLFLVCPDDGGLDDHLKSRVLQMEPDGKDWEQILSVIHLFKREKLLTSLGQVAREKGLYVYQRAKAYLAKKDTHRERSELYRNFLKSHDFFDSRREKDGLLQLLIDHFSSLDLFSLLTVIDLENYQDLEKEYSHTLLVPLDWLGMNSYCCFAPKQHQMLDKACFVITLMLESFERLMTMQGQDSLRSQDTFLWENAMESLPFPVSVVSHSGNIEVYNKKFTQLNLTPRECLSLIDKDVVEIKKSYFDLKIIPLEAHEEKSYLFLFLNQNEIEHIALKQQNDHGAPTVSSQDLGIISSSIAHELNNPLAGILAAISVLELEEWDEESLSIIEDMKNSAKRCKNLVEIFLSFTKHQEGPLSEVGIREVILQATELLRFRMIESNTRLHIEIKEPLDSFEKKMNLSLSSMFFYMILGEVLTDFNRQQVITGHKDTFLKGRLLESKNQIRVVFNRDVNIKDFVEESKLIHYLLGVQGFALETFDDGFAINAWSLL